MKRLILFELRKIWSRRLTLAALALTLAVSALFTISGYRNAYAFDGVSREARGGEAWALDRELAERYRGVLTDEKVARMMSDFALRQDLHGLNPVYLYRNATQAAVFCRFAAMDGGWNGRTVADVFGDEEIVIGFNSGWLQTSQDMVRSCLLLLAAVVVMTAPVFAGEYGGADSILLSSRYGRSRCVTAKLLAALLSAGLAAVVVTAASLLPALALYGGGGLGCSVLFAPVGFVESGIPYNLSCGEQIGWQALLVFTAALGTAGITLAVSALSSGQLPAAALSAALLLLPAMLPLEESGALFRLVSLLPVYQVQFFSPMSLERLGELPWAVLAVPMTALLTSAGSLIARRAFRRHQVR